MVSQSRPELGEDGVAVLVELGGPPGAAGSSSNCTGAATSWNGMPRRGHAVLQVAVGDRLRVDGGLERVLHDGPLAV